MTATTSSINHRISDDQFQAAQSWERMEKAAFPLNDVNQRETSNSHQQQDFLPLSGDTNLLNTFQPTGVPTFSKSRRMLSGESTNTCTPWRTKPYTCDPPGLHEEICDFYHYMKPRPSEVHMRRDVFMRVTHIIQSRWPQARVSVFGSMLTGLFLPTSDIDLVVFGNWPKLPLFSLEEEFRKADIAMDGSILVLDKTTVPIIKFIDKLTEVKVDISFNQETGLRSAEAIHQYIQEYPILPKLVLVLKQFLTQRQLNEVYYGGISSYSLILLLVSFLQLHPRYCATDTNANLGVLLIEFFELYGRNFNYMKTGISLTEGGYYFSKEELTQEPEYSGENAFLYIKDPISPMENAGRGCFGMWQVKQAFEHAYLRLHTTVISRDNPVPRRDSLLGTIIKVSQEVNEYRNWVDSIWPMPSHSPPNTPTHFYPLPMAHLFQPALPFMPLVPQLLPMKELVNHTLPVSAHSSSSNGQSSSNTS